ncbi:hypothetical protein HPB48_000617 [Haemaphysalis longicornis]|uniref:CCHC-type domain-containing protein n=1 Tax=Haemaphysalis longicornis TaxID=44386 RepID=A0A9J6FYZ6_HAELO|nr:hypothetical protein HPB48_000617 [Haemaphysalis longicornis]
MTLNPDVTPDDLPHVLSFYGGQVLVVVPGRAPLCLRCRRTGHMRREYRVPGCFKCRSFGNTADECVRTYASVVGGNDGEPKVNENLMEAEEAEATSRAATKVAVASQENHAVVEAATPPEPPRQDEGNEKDTDNAKKTEPKQPEEGNSAVDVSTVPMDAKDESGKRRRNGRGGSH